MKSNYDIDNKKKLNRARDILISVANSPRNKKFEKLASSEIFRAKQLRDDNNNNTKSFKRYKKESLLILEQE